MSKLKIILLLSLLIILGLSCSRLRSTPTVENTPIDIATKITMKPSSTIIPSTLTPTHSAPNHSIVETVISTVGPTPSLIPSLTPLPTLSPEDAQKEIALLMETNGQCTKPCLWGIIPGTTKFEEAIQFLKSLRAGGSIGIQNSNRFYTTSLQYKNNGLAIDLTIFELEGIVHSSKLYMGALHAPYVSKADWQAFRPDSILKTNGLPKKILIDMGEGAEGQISYGIILLYDQMYIEYDSKIFFQRVLHTCLLASRDIVKFRYWVGPYDEKEWPLAVELSKLTGVTLNQFYQLMTGDPQKACLDLNYNKYYNPNN